jgi:FkbM family methyltransferase
LFTYVLSKRFQRVHAFEVNKEVANPIAQYNPRNITLHRCGLSSSSRTARFYIPVTKGFASAGWGSFDRDNLPGAKEFIEMDVEVRPLDDFGITGVDFIKIDVEGREIEVLKGGAKTVEGSRPIVLIEVKDDHLQSVNAWFLARNFRHYSLEEVFNLKWKNANYLYVPAEQVGRLGICV